jgi:hypothetical protein
MAHEDVPGPEALGVGILDDVSPGPLQVAIAQSEKVEGVGVVVVGGSGLDVPAAHDRIRTAPLQERFLDMFTVGTAANGAFAGVALKWGESGRIVVVEGGVWRRGARVGLGTWFGFGT